MVRVKICGLTNAEDAVRSCQYGADLLGFIFAKGSPRTVEPDTAKGIIHQLPAHIGKTGLFKDTALDEVRECVLFCGLDHVQLHGDESPEYCAELKRTLRGTVDGFRIIKTFKVKDRILGGPLDEYVDADYVLFDTFHPEMMGGTGSRFDWGVLKDFRSDMPFFLAGGLTPQNVAGAVRTVHPYGVDVASGVEISAGKKDENKLKEFIQNARNA
ncbi:MAG: phosphoribosylanthranilate isomerase [Candidatus Omnitrophica bacterium]|nr:phosphoribosylanthranilate isomerase [Candidatus Omnitrophota bacterium]